jgi:hypothetical protein
MADFWVFCTVRVIEFGRIDAKAARHKGLRPRVLELHQKQHEILVYRHTEKTAHWYYLQSNYNFSTNHFFLLFAK